MLRPLSLIFEERDREACSFIHDIFITCIKKYCCLNRNKLNISLFAAVDYLLFFGFLHNMKIAG